MSYIFEQPMLTIYPAEVQSLLHGAIGDATKDLATLHPKRQKFAKSMLGSLRAQPAWEERYRVTGALDIPDSEDDDIEGAREVLAMVREVS